MEGKEIIDFCKRNIWVLLSGVFCLGAVCFFMTQNMQGTKKTKAQDYITAKNLFDRINSQECLSKESLESACSLLKKHAPLTTQYQGILSLALAQGGFTDISEEYTLDHLARIDSLLSPFHKEFVTIGFLISQNQKKIALEKSIALEEQLKQQSTNNPNQQSLYPRLRDFNRLRIAFLAKEIGEKETCQSAFQALSQSSFFPEIQKLFSEETFSLNDFFH